MTNFALYLTMFLSVLTVGAHFLAAFIIVALLFRNNYFSRRVLPLVRHYSIPLVFLIALVATIGSLIYSSVIGFDPCTLCWVQRVFIYPLVVIFGLALWRRDNSVVDYGLSLAIIGGLVALYQSFTQFSGFSLTECSAIGGSCAKIFFTFFGYVTIPVMSFTAFLLVILILLVKKIYKD